MLVHRVHRVHTPFMPNTDTANRPAKAPQYDFHYNTLTVVARRDDDPGVWAVTVIAATGKRSNLRVQITDGAPTWCGQWARTRWNGVALDGKLSRVQRVALDAAKRADVQDNPLAAAARLAK